MSKSFKLLLLSIISAGNFCFAQEQQSKSIECMPKFKISPKYTEMTSERIDQEIKLTHNSGYIDTLKINYLEDYRILLIEQSKKIYWQGENISEVLIIDTLPYYVDDKLFKEIKEFTLKYNEEGNEESISTDDIKIYLLDSGKKLFEDKYTCFYMVIKIPFLNRYVFQYLININNKSYSISINSAGRDIVLEDIVSLE